MPTWQHEDEREQRDNAVMSNWAGTPEQISGRNANYRKHQVHVIKRALAGGNGYKACCDNTRRRSGLYRLVNSYSEYVYFERATQGSSSLK